MVGATAVGSGRFGSVILVYLFTRDFFGFWQAVWSGLILASSFQFYAPFPHCHLRHAAVLLRDGFALQFLLGGEFRQSVQAKRSLPADVRRDLGCCFEEGPQHNRKLLRRGKTPSAGVRLWKCAFYTRGVFSGVGIAWQKTFRFTQREKPSPARWARPRSSRNHNAYESVCLSNQPLSAAV